MSENLIIIFIVAFVGIIALILTAYVSNSVFKNIDKIGKNSDLKKLICSRVLFNFFAIVILILLILTKTLDLIDSQLFIASFVVVLGGLGFKISSEIISKK